MNSRNLCAWLAGDGLGRFVWQEEWGFFQAALGERAWRDVLCLGDGGRLAVAGVTALPAFSGCLDAVLQCDALPADVVASAGRLPWRDEAFDCVVAPHLPDDDAPLLLALAELFRVVQPLGAVLVTGLNPHSVWRWWRDDGLPDVRNGVSFNRLRRLARMVGWQVGGGRFMVHLPPVGQPENWQLVETAGQLLWARNAAVYGVVLSKRAAGVRLRGDVEWAGDFEGMVLQGV